MIFLQVTAQQFVAQGLLEPEVVAVSLTHHDGIPFLKFVASPIWSIITSPKASMCSSLFQSFTNYICQKCFLIFFFKLRKPTPLNPSAEVLFSTFWLFSLEISPIFELQ